VTPPQRADRSARAGLLGASAVMAAGTVVSRLSGFVRSALLAAALGTQLHADVFTIANTVPNMLYILLAGGVLNAVLVPQLVRAMERDPDRGDAYTNRLVTVVAVFLAGVSAVLVLTAPWLMRLFLDPELFTDALTEQRESVIAFARLCLPQVFFYGMFVLLGQVLNARGRFGPMMWAPIANNVISVAVLLVYLGVYGPASGAELLGGYTRGQELLLGVGSTLGIAAQLAVLLPYLRASGFRFHPRLDLRGSGLGHTVRLGVWTVLFVLVNQLAYTVVVRIASSGTAAAAADAGAAERGAGYTVYSGSFLLVMVPHSVVTVSLATAMLPLISRHAAAGDDGRLATDLAGTLRTALAFIVSFAVLLPLVAAPLASLVWGYAAAADSYDDFARTMTFFAPGLVFFTVHYLVLRGFYAHERTRAVFWIQCVVAGANVAAAMLLGLRAPPEWTAPALAAAYSCAYLVGAAVSYEVLRRSLGGLETPVLVRFGVRMLLAVAVAWALTAAGLWLLDQVWAPSDGKLWALLLAGGTALVFGLTVLGLARLMRIEEVTSVLNLVTRRLRG
jgi:putative peptidoglycan lipid II flippase